MLFQLVMVPHLPLFVDGDAYILQYLFELKPIICIRLSDYTVLLRDIRNAHGRVGEWEGKASRNSTIKTAAQSQQRHYSDS